MHSLATTAPGWGRFRRVTTIHDLHYRTIPEAHFGVRALGMRVLVPLSARRSHRVIADSQATRDDVVEFLRVPPARVDVVHLGLGRRARAEPEPFSAGGRRVLMTAAAKRPHKNLAALLDALALLPADGRPLLVLPGYPTPHEQELKARAAALGIEGDVRFLGWVGDGQMEGLYAAAEAFVFPSLSEGFGLPVLEAMARGVPVACSNRPPLTEVAGDAALLFDPTSPRAIAGAIAALLGDDAVRARLRTAGPEHAARFTWAATAQATLRSYRRATAGVKSFFAAPGAAKKDLTPLRSARRRARARSARPRPWPRPSARRRARRPATPLPRPGVRPRTRTGARRSSSCGRRSR